MNNIEVKIYENKYMKKWDDFVEKSKNGTIFHTQRFLSYHSPNKFKDLSLLFLKEGNIITVISGCVEEETFYSHKGSTYGGFVVPYNFSISKALKIVEIFLDFLKRRNIKKVYLRLPEYIFEKCPSQEIKYALWYFGFKIKALELSTCYDLDFYDYSKKFLFWETKKSIKEGLKIIFDDKNYYRDFYNLLEESLKEKYKRKPTHSFKEIIKLKKLFPDKMFVITAYYENKVVGGILFFLANKKTAHIFYSTCRKNIKGIYPLESILEYLIKFLKNRNFKYLNYGISTENEGRKINLPLFKFKEKLKGFGVYREIWELEV